MLSLEQMLCVVPMLVSTSFHCSKMKSLIFKKIVVLLESPDSHSLLVVVRSVGHLSCPNTPESLSVLTAKNPDD